MLPRAAAAAVLPAAWWTGRRAGGRRPRRGPAGGWPARQRGPSPRLSPASTPAVQADHDGLCPRRRRLIRVSVAGAGGLCRPAGPDLLGLQHHPQGVHPAAGHGLPDCERATARRRLGGADAGVTDRVAADLPEHAGGEAHRGGGRHVVCLSGERLELRLDVRDSRRFRQAPARRSSRRTRSPPRCGSGWPPEVPGGRSASSPARRSAG